MPVELFGNSANKLFTVMDGMDETVDFDDLMTRFTLDAIGLAGFGKVAIEARQSRLIYLTITFIGFDFHAIKDSESEWVAKYNSFIRPMAHPLYLMLPVLERRFLWLLPGRKKAHKNMDEFLDMLDRIIEHKRRALKDQRKRRTTKRICSL